MDFELKSLLEKKIKAMSGGNYVGSKTTTDENGEHLDIQFKKVDGTIETTTIDFPKPKDGKDGEPGKKGDPGEKGKDGVGKGICSGGITGQILSKKSDTDFDTEWIDNQGGGGGSNIHNELEQLQGGMTGGKGEFYHLNKKTFDAAVKLSDDKTVEVLRMYTKDVENNIANLVSVSDFSTLYGNRLVANVQFSHYRDALRHMFNDGKVTRIDPIRPSEIISPGDYTQTIVIGKPKAGGPDISGYFVTKIQIQVESKGLEYPQVGRLELKSTEGKILFETCESGNASTLIDNYGNFKNKVLFDLPSPINVVEHQRVICNFKIESDRIMGSENLPSVILIVEELKDYQIADVEHIRELVPNAVSPIDIFDINVYDIEQKEACIMDIKATQSQIKYKKITVPLQDTIGNYIRGINCKIEPQVVFNEFISESARWVEFDHPNFEYFFDGVESLEKIYLPNVEDVLHDYFIKNCPNLKELYVPKLQNFGVNSQDFIIGCPNLVIYTKNDNLPLIDWCRTNGVRYQIIEIPSPMKNKAGDVLTVAEDGTIDWKPAQGGRDEMAIHKYPDLTKDFHTFFEPYASGVYRCFGMMENIPNGYFAGDNDFYAFVYAVSEKYKTVEILDIRSGRRFTKCMLAGKWKQWFEWGINQGGQIPLLIYSNVFTAGTTTDYPLSDLEITENDVLWISCGDRGMATKVDNIDYLEDYSASYFLDFENNKIICWTQKQGANPMSHIEIYKFVTTPVTPPRGGCPYFTIKDVLDDVSNATQQGDRFVVDLDVKSEELVRNPIITLDFRLYSYTTPLLFDGKAKHYFEFPFKPTGFNQGDKVKYTLSWKDQNGMLYEGFEEVTKDIMV